MVAAAATLWGVNGSLTRAVLDSGLGETRLSAVRITGTAVVLLVFVGLTARHHLRLEAREVVAFASFGVLGLVAVQWLYTFAVARMDVALVLVIEYLAPLLVAGWAVLVMREHVPRAVWWLTVAALVGLGLALGVGGDTLESVSGIGALAALGGAVAYAYYALHAERLMRGRARRRGGRPRHGLRRHLLGRRGALVVVPDRRPDQRGRARQPPGRHATRAGWPSP